MKYFGSKTNAILNLWRQVLNNLFLLPMGNMGTDMKNNNHFTQTQFADLEKEFEPKYIYLPQKASLTLQTPFNRQNNHENASNSREKMQYSKILMIIPKQHNIRLGFLPVIQKNVTKPLVVRVYIFPGLTICAIISFTSERGIVAL